MMLLRITLRYLLSGVPAPPPLGSYLWATLSVLVIGSMNLLFKTELWPNTPTARPVLELATSLAALLTVPQVAWWLWGWLQGYAGPAWLRRLATFGFWSAWVPGALLWIAGMGFWLSELASACR